MSAAASAIPAPTVNALLSAVLDYARMKLVLFPLLPQRKIPFGQAHECDGPPHQHGHLDATIDPAILGAWWRAHPKANIGMATGRGLDVLDPDGPEGEATLAALVAKRWPLPETCEVETSPGRRHIYFRSAGWPNTASKLGPKLDTRGLGGYVVLPPSVHPSGAVYTWTNLTPPASAPPWLTALLLRPEPARRAASRRQVREPSRYAAAALDDASRAVGSAPEGARNVTLNSEAFGIGQLVASRALDEGHAEDDLVSAAVSAGLAEAEARRTVQSAFRGGAAKPRNIGSAS